MKCKILLGGFYFARNRTNIWWRIYKKFYFKRITIWLKFKLIHNIRYIIIWSNWYNLNNSSYWIRMNCHLLRFLPLIKLSVRDVSLWRSHEWNWLTPQEYFKSFQNIWKLRFVFSLVFLPMIYLFDLLWVTGWRIALVVGLMWFFQLGSNVLIWSISWVTSTSFLHCLLFN